MWRSPFLRSRWLRLMLVGLCVVALAGAIRRGGSRATTTQCTIDPARELVITDLSVVEGARARGMGAWSFGRLISDLAPAHLTPEEFTEAFFLTWADSALDDDGDFLNINTPDEASPEIAAARSASIEQVIETWPRKEDGRIDLARAPFRLLAIVNRIDIGEGRFVFAFVGEDGRTLDGTIIFEYALPPVGLDGQDQNLTWWAQQWHQLGSLPLGSREFLTALNKLTDRFAGPGVAPAWPNGSALKALRTNEQLLDAGTGVDVAPVWQLREFALDPETGLLAVFPVNETPDLDYNTFSQSADHPLVCKEILIDYLVANKDRLLNGTFRLNNNGNPTDGTIQTGITAPMGTAHFKWLEFELPPDGISAEDWETMRLTFSQRTCNGCHSGDDGFIPPLLFPIRAHAHDFTHLSLREKGRQATPSEFLQLDIEQVRIPNMLSLVCPTAPGARRVDPRSRGVH